jgi:hypothetical protein
LRSGFEGKLQSRPADDHDFVIAANARPFGERSRVAPRPTPIAGGSWRQQVTPYPAFFPISMETPMRKLMSLGIAVMLALFAVGTWATATTRSQTAAGLSGERINTLELMSRTNGLPTEEFDAH